MVITEHFAWAHMGKTAGDATQQMFEAVPGLVEWAHSPDSNAKHDGFALHAAAISGRLRVMNIRRLPAWILSRTHHIRVHGPWPGGQRPAMATADEMAANAHPDFVLRRMSDGPRFPIQRWLRQEHLVDDLTALLEHFGQLSEAAREGIAGVPFRAKGYDHDLRSTFTAEQIRRMYRLNPGWAEVERRVYGDLYDLAEPHPADLRRPRSIPARFSRLTGSARRSAGSRHREAEAAAAAGSHRDDIDETDIDGWLTTYAGSRLEAIDRKLAAEGPRLDNYRLFRGLDDWVWALLLDRRYTSYLSILQTLPQTPDRALQERRDGAHGLTLLSRSLAFYKHLKSMQSEHGVGVPPTARILDFGCGWGRMTRFLCRDVDVGCLHACEPDEELLQICRVSRLPAVMHQAGFAPGELSEGDFDLAYSLSVFPRLPEEAAAAALGALHDALRPGGLAVITVRPPGDPGGGGHGARPGPDHPRDDGRTRTGDPVTDLPYLRDRWGDRFEIIDVTVLLEDIDQAAVTLRRP